MPDATPDRHAPETDAQERGAPERGALRTREFRRILLIKLSALGDVIHTLPFVHRLRARYPGARIDWLTKPANIGLLRHHPAIDALIPFPDEELRHALGAPMRGARALSRLHRALRQGHYDLVIDLQGQLRSAACALATGAPVRIGYDRPLADPGAASTRALPASAYRHAWTGAREGAWLAYTHRMPLATLDIHAVDRYLALGGMLGFADGPPDFSFPIDPGDRAAAVTLLGQHGMGPDGASARPYAVLAPGAGWETKRWPPKHFGELGRRLQADGFDVVLIGARGDTEACTGVERIAFGCANLCGATSLGQLAALVQGAALVVANDSGPMHLAAALSRPVVAIFGPTDPLWVGPYGQSAAVIAAGVSCAPCYLRRMSQCPHAHVCLEGLKVTEVARHCATAPRAMA